MPHSLRIRRMLRKQGLRIPDSVTDMEQLADYLTEMKAEFSEIGMGNSSSEKTGGYKQFSGKDSRINEN